MEVAKQISLIVSFLLAGNSVISKRPKHNVIPKIKIIVRVGRDALDKLESPWRLHNN